MSKQVDERVVSMEFDNKRFESNVKTSMSTLDKLKKSLNFDSATKGFSELDKAANHLSFNNIASGVEVLQKRFSTFGIVGMRVIENLTDSAMRLTSQITSFITSGVVQGGISRAMNLENAHFQLQGLLKDEEDVAAVMKNVSDSVDGTAYSLDSAAKVASQFAASGMRAGDEMFSALRAVAGVAAMTNSEYDEIGRIFTQVAGQGRLMGDQLLQLSSRGMNAAATLATYLGKTEAEVRDMTSKGEISFATFAAAMDDAFGEHAKKANETFTGAMSNVKAALARIGALFVSPLVEQNGAIVQMFNALREKINDIKASIGPIADFFVKSITSMTNALTSFIKNLDVKKPLEKFSSLFGSKWDTFEQKLEDAGISADAFKDKLTEVAKEHGISVDKLISQYGSLGKVISAGKISKSIIIETIKKFINVEKEASEATTDVTDKLDKFNQVVSQVVRGDFGNGIERVQKLTEAGYEAATVQKLVNYIWERNGKTWSDCSLSAEELADAITDLSDEELKSVGYTDDQVKKIRELAEEAEKAGTPINELLSSLDKPTTKDLVIDTFRNALQAIVATLKSVKTAWKETFSPASSTVLYSIVDTIHKFSEKLVITEDRAEKLTRTFKGLFAAFDIVRMILSGALSIAFKVLKAILSAFHLDVLDVTAAIGDAIVKFRDWVKEHDLLKSALDAVVPVLKTVVLAIKDAAVAVYDWAENSETVQKVLKFLSSVIDKVRKNINPWLTEAIKVVSRVLKSFVTMIRDTALAVYDWAKNNETIQRSLKTLSDLISKSKEGIASWIDGIKDADNIPKYILSGLINGLKSGVALVANVMFELGRTIITSICEVLGIHSPSTEFFEIGKNAIAGFVLGIKEGASNAWEALKSFGRKCIEIIKSIDFRAVLAAVLVGGITATAYKMAKALESFGQLFSGLGSMFSNVGKGVNNLLTSIGESFKAKAFETKSKAILNFAIAIGILAASIYVLAQLDSGPMWEAVGVIAAMVAVISLMAFAISKLNLKESVKIGSFALGLVGIGASLLMLSSAMKRLSGMSDDEILRGAKALGVLAVFITALIAVTEHAGKGIDNVGGMLLKVSIAMLLMVMVMKSIAKLDENSIMKGLTVIGSFTIFISALMAMSKVAGNGAGRVDRLGSMLLKISASMMLLVLVMKAIANMDAGSIAKGLTVITLFSAIIVGLMAATRLAGNADKIGATILGISAAIAIMAMTLYLVEWLEPSAIAKGIAAITAFGAIITGLIYAVKLAGKDFAKVGTTILLVSVAIAILAGIAVLLGFIDLENLAKGIVAVGFLSAIVGALIIATSKAKDCKANLIVMVVAISLLVAAIIALSFIDQEKIKTAVAAISSVIGMFALLVASTKIANDTKSMRKTLIEMLGIVVVLAGVIAVLASLNPQAALEASKALSLLLLSFSASLVILSKAGEISKNAFTQIAPMLAVVAGLAAILGILAYLNVEASIQTAIALSVLLNGMVVAMAILSKAGPVSISSLGALAIIGLVVAEIAVILGLLSYLDVEPSIETATALSVLLLGMSVACAIVSMIPAVAAIQGAVGLAAFVGIMGTLLVALGALSKIPGVNDLIKDGGKMLSSIGYALGNFVGSIVGGVAAGVASGLPAIGASLSEFMTNLTPFLTGIKQITPESLDGVKALAGAILALTAVEVLNGMATFLSGGSSFAKMGADLSAFMINAMPFITGASMLTEEVVSGVKALADAILVITAVDLLDGIASWITGGSSIADFAAQLPILGSGLAAFSASVEGINVEAVTAATSAAKALAEMASVIPNEGGMVAWFTGDNSMANFAGQLPILGSGLAAFSTSVEGINIEAITAATSAAKALAEMASVIPNEGGMVAWFTGDNSVANFAGQLSILGSGLAAFSTSVENLNIDNVAAATSAARTLADMASIIPNEGGIVAWFTGDNSVANFAGQLPILGAGLASFSESVSAINAENVTAATSAAKSLAEMASIIPNEGGMVAWFTGDNSVANFAGQLPVLGQGLSAFSESVQNVNSEKLTAAASSAKALAEMTEHIPNEGGIKAWFSGESGVAKFASNLPTLGDALKGFSDSVAGINPENVTAASVAAKNLAEMAETAPKNTDKLAKFGDNLIQFGEKLKTYFSKMKDIGPDTISTSKNVSSAISQVGTNINPSGIKSACEAIDELVKTIKKCSSIKADETSGFVSSVKKLGTVTANALVKTFNESNSKMVDAGKKLISKFIEGMDSKQDAVSKSGKTLVSKASSAVKSEDQYSKFKSAGKYLGDGLVEGINAKQQAAYDAGYTLGQKAAQGEKDGQKSNSPSKLTIQAGKWLGEGLVIGIQKMFNPVYNAGHDLGETATGTISSAISKLVDVMDSDIDMLPTIRPVLDLSDIESGAGTINGMLSLNPAITATNRVGSINSNMRRVGQNGTADDITSAIENLGRKMDNMSGDTYNINGVTYDDDSSIANAVKTIVRAARVERRA